MSLFALLAIIAMFAANALFVAAEFALVSARRPRLAGIADEGRFGAKRALRQYDDMSRSLSACQLGITLASIGIGAVGEHAVSEMLEHPMENLVGLSAAAILSVLLGYLIITSLHITTAEQVPKMAAIGNPEAVSCLCSAPLLVFELVFRPLIWLLDRVTSVLLNVLRIKRQDAHGSAVTLADVRTMALEGKHGGTLDANEAGMLSGVVHLHTRTARDVMTSAPAISDIHPEQTVREAIEVCVREGHSRLLVIDSRGVLHGMVSSHDLMQASLDNEQEVPCEKLVREVIIVPENKPLDDLLSTMQRRQMSLAAVVDEYGTTIGVVSAEDIVEEIVGEIDDESDARTHHAVREADGSWLVSGQATLTDLRDEGLDLPMHAGPYATMAGLIMHRSGKLPQTGETVSFDGWSATVLNRDGARIDQVRLSLV